MTKVVLFGEGKIAEEIFVYFTNDSEYDVAAFTVDEAYLRKESLFGKPIVPFERIVESHPPDQYKMFVALGYQDLNRLRQRKYEEAKAKGYELVSYVCSKAANIGNVKIGENSLVLEHSTIQPLSKVGSNVFIWSGNHLGHHAEIKDHTYVCGHVVISGDVVVGRNCFLGVNATIGHNVILGEKCIVGAGAVITKNAEDGSVFVQPPTPPFRLDSEHFMKITGLE